MPRPIAPPDAAVLAAYVTWLGSWAANRTAEARQHFIAARLRQWGGVAGFTENNVLALFAAIAETHHQQGVKSSWTIPTYHAHLSDFCAWAVAAGHLDTDPMTSIRKQRRPKSRPRPLSDPEVDHALGAATGRVRDWMLLALLAGLRVSEIAAMRGEHVGTGGLYVEGKGGSVEVLPMRPELREMAERYPSAGYWFPGTDRGHVRSTYVSRDVAEVFRSVGIMEGSAHRLRHTYGTRLLRSGVNIRKVQKLMRHANLETTAGYTAVDEDELQAAVDALPAPPPLAS